MLVEAALVFPVLMLLLFGIIEFGFQFNDYQAVRQGVRDGARQGVVGQYGTTTSCGLAGLSTANTATQELMCLTKDRIGLGSGVRVKVIATGTTSNDQLVVCAQQPMTSFTALFSPYFNGRQLRSRVDMRIEKTLSTAPTSDQETAPTGGSWSWCAP